MKKTETKPRQPATEKVTKDDVGAVEHSEYGHKSSTANANDNPKRDDAPAKSGDKRS